MSGRTRRSGLTIEKQIIHLLREKEAMKVRDIIRFIPSTYKAMSTTMYRLKNKGLVVKRESGLWSLIPRATTQVVVREETTLSSSDQRINESSRPSGSQVDNPTETPIIELDQRSAFIQALQAVGCSPKESAETIMDLFFAGDINDPKWLNHVLTRDAVGFLEPGAQRLMFSFWCHTRGLQYEDEDLPRLVADDEETNQTSEILEPKLAAPRFDPGLGWRIEKDGRGHWVSVPGGPLAYEEAFRYAQQREFISRYVGRLWR